MTKQAIIFEQPVNELIRLSLRLEHLFEQLDYYLADPQNTHHVQSALITISHILSNLDRSDLRKKLYKEFNRHATRLKNLQNNPQIAKNMLGAILKELDLTQKYLQSNQGKLAQWLRENEFLDNIRQHFLTPGATCCADLPALHCWLQQPERDRSKALTHWLEELNRIKHHFNLLLRLIRGQTTMVIKNTESGFYQQNLDSQKSWQLIRVEINSKHATYPEISVGRHRLCIRFLHLNTFDRPIQLDQNMEFALSCCD